ncbi:zinc finger, GRF-type [Artemisia annua]|uniref:Zinc finger, GRF-type n=1 Tax=Artemisia annua TaxID=35608 RepID=A0A2U1N860_ARTAN|nr:zinc finger, GRF-type [Artemisia annua]
MVRCARCQAVCVIKTSWTNRNPGRRFYGCPHMDCNRFMDWVDPEMCPRSMVIIPGLLRSLNRHQAQIQEIEEERSRLKKYLIVTWVLVVVSVMFKLLN